MPRPTPWWFRSSRPSRATSPKAACCSAKCAGKPLFRLKFDPLVGALEIDLERLAQAVRVIPHAAEYRELDDDELLDLHVVRIRGHVLEPDALVRQHPAQQRGWCASTSEKLLIRPHCRTAPS